MEYLGQLEYNDLVKEYGAPLKVRTNRSPCAFRLDVSIWMKPSNVDYRRERVREREGVHGAAVTRTGIGVASLKPIIALLPSLAVDTAERNDRQVPSKHTVCADTALRNPLRRHDITRLNDITQPTAMSICGPLRCP